MNASPELIDALERLLVKEFRLSQTLFDLVIEERAALSRDEAQRLRELAREKQALLDQLAQLENSTQFLLQNMGVILGIQPRQMPDLVDVLPAMERQRADRLRRLQEGIQVLGGKIRELTRENCFLVSLALNHTNNLQSYLVGLYQFPVAQPGESDSEASVTLDSAVSAVQEQPTPTTKEKPALLAAFTALVSAREALQNHDQLAISNAMDNLQSALERLSKSLESREAQTQPISASVSLPLPVSPELSTDERSANLMEALANLYHRETAYQAMLSVSHRILTSV